MDLVCLDEPLPYNEGIIEMSVYGPCVFVDTTSSI